MARAQRLRRLELVRPSVRSFGVGGARPSFRCICPLDPSLMLHHPSCRCLSASSVTVSFRNSLQRFELCFVVKVLFNECWMKYLQILPSILSLGPCSSMPLLLALTPLMGRKTEGGGKRRFDSASASLPSLVAPPPSVRPWGFFGVAPPLHLPSSLLADSTSSITIRKIGEQNKPEECEQNSSSVSLR